MQWDIFCKVIDNHGDIGVCWRLCRDLAARGQQARLWVDDAGALAWMAPGAPPPGVRVCRWTAPLKLPEGFVPGEVLVEAFGCEPAFEFVAAYAQRLAQTGAPAAWLNLEYLSAEAYVARSHKLPSPVLSGPGAGLTKHFFYPGFSAATGGLLREIGLLERQKHFDAAAWRAQQGVVDGALAIALFCYEPAALPALLDQLTGLDPGSHLLVTDGRASRWVRQVVATRDAATPGWNAAGRLRIHYLPALSQDGFDQLLWACDLNFVRGEDSLVRALWAGKPLVWQLYPQDDGAHGAKLQAFLDALQPPDDLRAWFTAWNAATPQSLPPLRLAGWQGWADAARARLLALPDLGQRLLEFAQSLGAR
jgi:uncharacterized repeat protein (TIGR03837 family)